ncbi:nicotinate-nucleotide adenylyltransferase [Pectinatus brassicae]|uniref:Probable nicotinate-nucleotide adenylyltransferase n=1 Tax=Pectinatus brassicae TaxID=862415 RepID=A0A840UJC8_9FIRM|nr:nicotinate-nucleotide adenylyltransferase [Pectinatus brassicae]MBB5337246.1 nicotinate-nucleotide adenylyltransferase [Pectinatus brassicae]
MKKVGIMGGTFDPIHYGHLMTAEAVRDEYNMHQVIFIPAANPPHKSDWHITAARHRFNMTLLATCSNPYFEVSDIEMRRIGPSYTIDTVKELIQIYPDDTEFYFITGADAMQELPSWHKIDELLEICHFIAATRQGCLPDVTAIKKHFGDLGNEHIHRLATPELEISSTDIRERLEKGYSIKYILPEPVEQYIRKEHLYLT